MSWKRGKRFGRAACDCIITTRQHSCALTLKGTTPGTSLINIDIGCLLRVVIRLCGVYTWVIQKATASWHEDKVHQRTQEQPNKGRTELSKVLGSAGKTHPRKRERERLAGNSARLWNPQEGQNSQKHADRGLRWSYLTIKGNGSPQSGNSGDTHVAFTRLKFFLCSFPVLSFPFSLTIYQLGSWRFSILVHEFFI